MVELKISGRVSEALDERYPNQVWSSQTWVVEGNVIIIFTVREWSEFLDKIETTGPELKKELENFPSKIERLKNYHQECVEELQDYDAHLLKRLFNYKEYLKLKREMEYFHLDYNLKSLEEERQKLEARRTYDVNRNGRQRHLSKMTNVTRIDLDIENHSYAITQAPDQLFEGSVQSKMCYQTVSADNVLLAILNGKSKDFEEIVNSANKNLGDGCDGLKMYLATESDWKIKFVKGTFEDLLCSKKH